MKKNKKGFTLVELMIVVVILGILAAIAIPLYMKFVQSAKAGEARLNLGKIGSLSEAYFNSRREGGSNPAVTPGALLSMIAAFPRCGAVETDCAAGCGTDAGNGEQVPALGVPAVTAQKFLPTEANWMGAVGAPTAWSRLPFAITQPIQYMYCYGGSFVGTASIFTSAAYGDIDGDTVVSTFKRLGTAVDGAPMVGPVAVLNETE